MSKGDKRKLGNLTGFLQERFAASCPSGWSCQHEVDVLDEKWQRALGYSAWADVLLTRDDGQKRLWIEFEVSRADPVANHAKFATSHLFQPQASTDTFIAMISSHVTRGRRNLAANTILLMRRVGMRVTTAEEAPHISQAFRNWQELNTDHIRIHPSGPMFLVAPNWFV
ncbi:MAG: hypothetical protein ACK5PB_17815 [Pirellula sp.]